MHSAAVYPFRILWNNLINNNYCIKTFSVLFSLHRFPVVFNSFMYFLNIYIKIFPL